MEHREPIELKREADGKYGFDGDWQRLCKCGHTLGVHAAQNDTGKRPCFNGDFDPATGQGVPGATGEDCDCPHFRPSGKHAPQPTAQAGEHRHNGCVGVEYPELCDCSPQLPVPSLKIFQANPQLPTPELEAIVTKHINALAEAYNRGDKSFDLLPLVTEIAKAADERFEAALGFDIDLTGITDSGPAHYNMRGVHARKRWYAPTPKSDKGDE